MDVNVVDPNAPLKGNYLSRLGRLEEKRRYDRRKCNFMARIVYTRDGLKNLSVMKASIQDISEGGAMAIMPYDEVPRFFYLVVGKYQLQIGCSVVSHKNPVTRISFIQLQDSALIDFLAQTSKPGSTLEFMKRLDIYI